MKKSKLQDQPISVEDILDRLNDLSKYEVKYQWVANAKEVFQAWVLYSPSGKLYQINEGHGACSVWRLEREDVYELKSSALIRHETIVKGRLEELNHWLEGQMDAVRERGEEIAEVELKLKAIRESIELELERSC